jgi:hypothetical protein
MRGVQQALRVTTDRKRFGGITSSEGQRRLRRYIYGLKTRFRQAF